jgi:TrmH family RNA methyltransferase
MARPETISSAANPLLKDVRRAMARGSLTSKGWCVAETFHLLAEALRAHSQIRVVLAAESVYSAASHLIRRHDGIQLVTVPDRLLQSLSDTETSQGVMALVEPPHWNFEDLFGGCPLLVVLAGLQDPGNAGAIIRAAEGFGATGALFTKGTVSPYNPKTLRASAGSLFRVPFLHGTDPVEARAAIAQHGVKLFAAVPTDPSAPASEPSALNFRQPCGFIIGSEAHGIAPELRSAAQDVSIRTVAVESLNAAVAAGILLYEARRQRDGRP